MHGVVLLPADVCGVLACFGCGLVTSADCSGSLHVGFPPGAHGGYFAVVVALSSNPWIRQSPGVIHVERKMQQLAPPGAVNTSRCGKATNPASTITSDTRVGRRRFSGVSTVASAIAAAATTQKHAYAAHGSPGARSPASKQQLLRILALASAASTQ